MNCPKLKEIDLSKSFRQTRSATTTRCGHSDIELSTFYIGRWDKKWFGGYFEKTWFGWVMFGTCFPSGIQLSEFDELYELVKEN